MGAAFRAVSGRPGASFAPWATRPGRSRLRLGRYLTRRQASSWREGAAFAPGQRLTKGRARCRSGPGPVKGQGTINAAFAARPGCLRGEGLHRVGLLVVSAAWALTWWRCCAAVRLQGSKHVRAAGRGAGGRRPGQGGLRGPSRVSFPRGSGRSSRDRAFSGCWDPRGAFLVSWDPGAGPAREWGRACTLCRLSARFLDPDGLRGRPGGLPGLLRQCWRFCGGGRVCEASAARPGCLPGEGLHLVGLRVVSAAGVVGELLRGWPGGTAERVGCWGAGFSVW